MTRNMAHRIPGRVPESPQMRARNAFHVDGQHKVPREGVRPDHYYACSWCKPSRSHQPDGTYGYYDGEVETFHLPQSAAENPMAAIAGRLG